MGAGSNQGQMQCTYNQIKHQVQAATQPSAVNQGPAVALADVLSRLSEMQQANQRLQGEIKKVGSSAQGSGFSCRTSRPDGDSSNGSGHDSHTNCGRHSKQQIYSYMLLRGWAARWRTWAASGAHAKQHNNRHRINHRAGPQGHLSSHGL